jgi:hypothetical protein
MNNHTLKGQFWSFDVIFAIVIFSFAITILAFTWFNINNQLSIGYGNGSGIMQLQLQTLTQSLLSPGTPSNWQSTVNTTNPATWSGVSIGLTSAQGGYMLSPSKVYTFASMSNENYQATKQALGIGFDYYITIKSNTNVGSGINMSIGSSPFKGALTVYVDKTNAIMNGAPVTVEVILWTNTTIATE